MEGRLLMETVEKLLMEITENGIFRCGARGDRVRLRHRVNITKKCKLGVRTEKLKSSS